jgi:ketosteroid isomerase-like protein
MSGAKRSRRYGTPAIGARDQHTARSGQGKRGPVGNRFGMLYEIQGDKISRWTVYDDSHAALEAAGLQE